MSFRIGEYECSGCGYFMPAAPQPPAKPDMPAPPGQAGGGLSGVQNTSGPVLRRDASAYGGGWTPSQAPPAPVAPSHFGVGGLPPEDMFQLEGAPPPPSGLLLEKNIYFGISALGAGISLLGSFSGGVGSVIGALFWTAINLGLLWFVLHAEEGWAKWACGGCTLVGWLALIGVMVMPEAGIWSMVQQKLPFSGLLGSAMILLGLRALWDLWLLSILWRDIQRLQSAGY